MPQLLVRDVPLEVVEALKREARSHGRSAEAEHRDLLVRHYQQDWSTFRREAARLRKETEGRSTVGSEILIREARDSR
ncbi:MAG: hypothetical protein JWM33_2027 [Caulobacteraceae bacterium]|nr:hypothetical protein [Caulobacteraceae bacterium]